MVVFSRTFSARQVYSHQGKGENKWLERFSFQLALAIIAEPSHANSLR